MESKNSKTDHDSHGSHGDSHYVKIWALLTVLLVISVCGPMLGIRWLTLITAFGIAFVKAIIVAREFMHLNVEKKIVSYIFCGMLVLVGIFFFGTAADVMKPVGQNWYKQFDEEAAIAAEKAHSEGHGAAAEAKVETPAPAPAGGKSRFSKAWVVTPELIANGKQQYQTNCATCHGAEGKGDGAAAAALNPKPRNFATTTGWKQGRKPSQIFNTLTKGVGGMPAFGSLSQDDRWSLTHFVRTLGSHEGEKDSLADLKKIGIDPANDTGGGEDKVIPIGLAIEQIASGAPQADAKTKAKK